MAINTDAGQYRDGGVYDNVAVRLMDFLRKRNTEDTEILFIFSDAGQPFRNSLGSSSVYRGMLDRLTRASDIQFYRLADADSREFEKKLEGSGDRILTIQIGDVVSTHQDDVVLAETVQKQVCRIRTDLDKFCDEEIHAIIRHGWEGIRAKWHKKTGLRCDLNRTMDWQPAGKELAEDQLVKALEHSERRELRVAPLVRFFRRAFLNVLCIGIVGFLGVEAQSWMTQPRQAVHSYSIVENSIRDFPPLGPQRSSLENAFLHDLPPGQFACYYTDVMIPFETSGITISLHAEGADDEDAKLVRSWTFCKTARSDTPYGEIVWVRDRVKPVQNDGSAPKHSEFVLTQRHAWAKGSRLRFVFAVTGARAESITATARLSPSPTLSQRAISWFVPSVVF